MSAGPLLRAAVVFLALALLGEELRGCPGEGARVREKEALAREERDAADVAEGRRVRVFVRKVGRVVG